MEVQGHKNSTSSEHEIHGVHLCHKCGWPFPNPHPSAKHRRAHKRGCGTIEGYKLTNAESDHSNLAGSDNEQLSDDDQRTPSPEADKPSVKELGSSGGMVLKSSRSEEEFFSDAVTEFSDSGFSPILEERLERVKQLDKSVGRELLHDLENAHVSKVEKTADTSQPLHDLTQMPHDLTQMPQGPGKAIEMSDSDVVGSKGSQLEITKSISDIGTENVSVAVSNTNGLEHDSSRVISEFVSVSDNSTIDSEIGKQKELISSSLGTDIKEKEKGIEAIDVHSAAASDVLQSENNLEIEPKLEQIEGKTSGPVALEDVALETDKETADRHIEPEFQSKLSNVNVGTSHAGIVDEIVDQERELTNSLQSEHDVSSQIEPPKFEHPFVSEVESDSAKNLIYGGHGQSDEVCDLKEAGNEDTYLLPATKPLSAVENPEVMIGDFKDYKVLNSSFPLDLGVAEEMRSADDDKKVTVPENLASALSDVTAGNADNSSSDALEDDLQKEGVSAPSGGEIGSSVPENLPSAHSSVLARTVDNFSTEALEDDLEKEGVSSPNDGEVAPPVPENLPSALSSVSAGTVGDTPSEALEDDLKKEGVSTAIDGEAGTSVPENLPSVPAGTVDNSILESLEDDLKKEAVSTASDGEIGTSVPENFLSALSSVPAGSADNSTLEALEDDLKKEGVSTLIDAEVGTSVRENPPSALSSVPAGSLDNSSSEPLKDDLKEEGVSTSINGEVGTSVPENPTSALSSVSAGTVDNSSSETLEDDLKKEGVSTPINGEVGSSEFRVTSDEDTHLLSVAETLPAVENPEAMIGDLKNYNVLKSSFSLDIAAAEEIRSVEDDKKVTVPENLQFAISNVPAGSVDNSSSDNLEDELKKEGVSIPIDGEDGTSGFRGTSDDDTRLLSATETSPAVENPEVMTGDFKDNKVLKSSFPSDLGAAEEVRSVEDDKKVIVPENLPSTLSNVPAESVDNSSSDTLEDDLKKEGVSIPIDGEVGASGFRFTGNADFGSSGSGDHPKTSGSETNNSQPNNNLEGSLPQSLFGKPLKNEYSEPTTREHSDVIALESSAGEQTRETTNLSGGGTADNHGIDELLHGATENRNKQAGNELSANTKTTLTHVEAIPETIEKSIPLAGDDSLAIENPRMGFSSTAGNETMEVAAEEKLAKYTDLIHESMHLLTSSASLDEARGSNQVDIDARDSEKLCNSSESPKFSDEIPNTFEGLKMGDQTEVPRSSGTPVMISELKFEDPTVPSEKTSENSSSEKIAAFHIESEVPNKSSASIEDINVRDATISGPFFDDGEDKVAKQDSIVMAVDNSIISSSGTDTLDENSSSEKIATFPRESEVPNKSSASIEDINARDATISGPFLDDGEDKVAKQDFIVTAVDNSIISSSPTDSLDANWGSVSVLSIQSDVTAAADAEVLSSTDTRGAERLESDIKKPQAAAVEYHPDKSDVFEPPSFMTLVESGVGDDKNAASSEIQTARRDEQTNSEALQAGWFPSLTNVVNESEGRKKNEEIIAKVTNWSTGKQHSPLKNLLSEAHAETKAKSPNTKNVPAVNQADETALKNNGTAVTTVSSILGSEMPSADTVKKEMEKEWNSPARYPIQIKKEKRKGKPYWVPFVCCTSVHQDV